VEVLRFLDEVQQEYYADMHAYLRGLGVRVPISGNTWLVYPANLPSQVTMDFMDSHAYWDHPYDDYSRFHNRPQVKADPAHQGTNVSGLAASRVEGKPYVCSEWGHPWPNEWRAEGMLPMAAIGAFQGWDGVLAYTYRHSSEAPVGKLAGYFDTFNDPCVFGLMPAGALIFRRGDVSSAHDLTAVLWEGEDVFSTQSAWNSYPAYRALVEQTGLVTTLGGPTGAGTTIAPEDALLSPDQTSVESDTGELRRDWEMGVGTIDTARTQAAYGFLGAAGEIALADVTLSVETPFATVAVTSLDGAALRESDHVLITAVGRAENRGMEYNLTHTGLRSWGSGPILIEPIVGRVTMQTEMAECWVYAVRPGGAKSLLRTVAAAGGAVAIDLTAEAGTIYYEIGQPARFSDVRTGHWGYDEIEACVEGEMVFGYPDGTYRPCAVITRDQMATYVARAIRGAGSDVPWGPGVATFPDVPTDHWAYDAVECAAANAVVEGYGDGTYHPEWEVTRGQMSVYIARALVAPTGEAGLASYEPPETGTFPDVPTDYWSFHHTEYLAEEEVVAGYPDGLYHPISEVTRAQMAVYVAKAFGLMS
jgi:hypothetical protein